MNRQNSATSISTPGPPGHPNAPLGYPQGPYGGPNLNPGGLSTLGGPPPGSIPGPGTPMPGSMQNGPMQGGMPGTTIPGGGPGLYYTTAPGAGRGIPLGPNGVPMQGGGRGATIVVNGQPGPPGTMQTRYTTGPIQVQRLPNGMGIPAGMTMGRGAPPMIGMNIGAGPGGQQLPPTVRMARPVSLQPTHPQYAQFSQPPPSGMGSMQTSGQPHMLIPQPPTSIQPGPSGQPGPMGQPGGGGQPPPPGQGQGRGQPTFTQQMAINQMNQMNHMRAAQMAQQPGGAPMGNAMTMAAGQMGSAGPPPQRPPSVQQTPQTQPLQPQLTGGGGGGPGGGPGGGGQPGQQMQMGPPMGGGQPMMGLVSTPMGGNPMANFMTGGGGASPQRNSSPHPNSGRASAAGTPANQPTPQRRSTPANASSPYGSGRPPTPNNRAPSTQPLNFPSHQTPQMRHQEAMMLPNPQASPQQMHRTVQQGQPGGPINASIMRPTPAQIAEHVSEMYAPGGGGPGPGPGGYTVMYRTQPGQPQQFHPGLQRMNPPQPGPLGAPPTPLQPQHTGPGPTPLQPQHTGPGPGQGPHPATPLQPQLTGGSMHDQPMQSLQPQHTGGGGGGPGGPGQQPPQQQQQQSQQPLVPQHTGGSMHGDTVMGPPPGRGSVPNTPRMMAARPPGPGMMGPPPPGMIMTPMGMMQASSMSMGTYPMHMSSDIGPPPPGSQQGMPMGGMNAGLGQVMREMPSEMDNVNESSMKDMGIVGHGTEGMRRHAFGTLRLLQFSHHLGNVKGHDFDRWAGVINEHFTESATFTFRAFKDAGTYKNTFVELPYNLIVRFFETLTQSSINRMSIVLDGVTETQEGADYIVYCRNARWPMYYENGYVIELHGTLKARCRTVPFLPNSSESGTPSFQEALPPGQPMKTEPSSNNLGTSPSNNADTRRSPHSKMDVDVKPNGPSSSSSSSGSKMPYIVKIEELCFDNEGMQKWVDVSSRPSEHELSGPTSVQQPDRTQSFELPPEPPNMYGMPQLTMRMLELSEGSEALMPLMGWAAQKRTTPISAIHDFVQHFNGMKHPLQGMVQPPTQPPMMTGMISIPFGANPAMYLPPGMHGIHAPPGFAFLPAGGPPPGSQHPSDLVQASLPEGDIGYSTLDTISRPPTASMTINPSTLSNNGPMGGMANGPPGSSNAAGAPGSSSAPSSTSAPSLSPTLSTKPPGKRGTMPSSPTKGDKTGSKRRNTGEATAEPPSKRKNTTRKASKAQQ